MQRKVPNRDHRSNLQSNAALRASAVGLVYFEGEEKIIPGFGMISMNLNIDLLHYLVLSGTVA